MTEQEKAEMMAEIMNVVDKHVAKSEGKTESDSVSNNNSCNTDLEYNPQGNYFSTRKENMDKWKDQYKRMRLEGRIILEDVRNNPIDTSKLTSSFDVDEAYNNI